MSEAATHSNCLLSYLLTSLRAKLDWRGNVRTPLTPEIFLPVTDFQLQKAGIG